MKNIFIAIFICLCISSNLQAHPVSYKGALSVMSVNQADMNDYWMHYSANHRFSLGVRLIRLDQKASSSRIALSQFGLLVKRWNREDFQANIYAFGGVGAHNYSHENAMASLGGAKIDVEDRKYFLSATYEALLQNEAKDFHRYTARAGIAPYVASYEQLHSWLMVEYQFKPGHDQEHDVIPMMRFFYRNVLWEMGSSIKGSWMLNFMAHF